MKLPRRLFLIRHGQKHVSRETSNQKYPLTELGKMQAAITRQYLLKRLRNDPPTQRFRATLNRAIETDEIIFDKIFGLAPGLEPITDSRLDEKSGGIFDEFEPDQIESYYPLEIQKKNRLGYYHNRPLGGHSCPDIELKLHSFIAETRFYEEEVVVINGHGTSFRLLHKILGELNVEEFLRLKIEVEIPNCAVIEYSRDMKIGKDLPKITVPWKGILPDSKD